MAFENKKTIAIAGNPNCGKTTLFNGLTGGKQIIGNWPGVTVEKLEGVFHGKNGHVKVVDLPGIYSLSASSIDEKAARDYILMREADLIVNVIDASNIERNMYLTTQLLEMKVPMIILLNRIDIAKRHGIDINSEMFSRQLGIGVYELNATKDSQITGIKNVIEKELSNPRTSPVRIEYPDEIENIISEFRDSFSDTAKKFNTDSRWISIKLLENDGEVSEEIRSAHPVTYSEFSGKLSSVEKLHGESSDIIIADYRYGFIHGLISKIKRKLINKQKTTDMIDRIVLNKFTGIPIFMIIMFIVFSVTMNFGGALIDFFGMLSGAVFIDGFRVLLENLHSPSWLITIFSAGVGTGIQTIATFIPIIFFMFLMLAVLEDSGYMARAAFLMDRLMRHMGLPGKSFVPLIVGFGCTVPAIMASRTLDNYRDRVMTVFMTPFMSCGARLPVYAIFSAAFFGKSSGLVVFSLYLAGILLSIGTGIILKKNVFKGEVTYFVMELPTYNYPRLKHIMIHTWNRLKIFIRDAGKIIILGIVILSFLNSIGTDFTFGNEGKEKSLLSQTGKFITPLFTPLGIEKDNWPASVALFTGIVAKEAVVGTLTSLYGQINSAAEDIEQDPYDFSSSVKEAFMTIPVNIKTAVKDTFNPFNLFANERESAEIVQQSDEGIFPDLKRHFRKGRWQAYSYLLFILIYFPCLAATGAIFREIGYKLGMISISYLTVLAWAVSTLFYQITTGHDIIFAAAALFTLAAIYLFFILLGRKNEIKKICREDEC
ncbi:MAG: Fe(2+) transporter permease subunit FeoB [Spirochaetes bacterium]|nr:Fe(2+) transporter permease subunit FeoB [Spirochaetota bacterium]